MGCGCDKGNKVCKCEVAEPVAQANFVGLGNLGRLPGLADAGHFAAPDPPIMPAHGFAKPVSPEAQGGGGAVVYVQPIHLNGKYRIGNVIYLVPPPDLVAPYAYAADLALPFFGGGAQGRQICALRQGGRAAPLFGGAVAGVSGRTDLCAAQAPCGNKDVIKGSPKTDSACANDSLTITRELNAVIHYVILPGSVWESPAYQRKIKDRQDEAQIWWRDNYCINISYTHVELTDEFKSWGEDSNNVRVRVSTREYLRTQLDKLRSDIVNRAKKREIRELAWPELVCHRDIVTDKELNAFIDLVGRKLDEDVLQYWNRKDKKAEVWMRHNFPEGAELFRRAPQDLAMRLLIVYGDWYAGDGVDSGGFTMLGSQATATLPQIGIMAKDGDTKHILTHEFIHAFGKSSGYTQGGVTWHHTVCRNSMQAVFRTNPCGGSQWKDSMLLHAGAYEEIAKNGCGWLFYPCE
jgi:hypothetical protein